MAPTRRNKDLLLEIRPNSEVRTYMVGSHLWDLSRGMEAGAGRVVIPTGHEL